MVPHKHFHNVYLYCMNLEKHITLLRKVFTWVLCYFTAEKGSFMFALQGSTIS